jgi:hypothetical protein
MIRERALTTRGWPHENSANFDFFYENSLFLTIFKIFKIRKSQKRGFIVDGAGAFLHLLVFRAHF